MRMPACVIRRRGRVVPVQPPEPCVPFRGRHLVARTLGRGSRRGRGRVGWCGAPCGDPVWETGNPPCLLAQDRRYTSLSTSGRPQGPPLRILSITCPPDRVPAPTRPKAFPSGFTKNLPLRGHVHPHDAQRVGRSSISSCIDPSFCSLARFCWNC